MKVSILLGIMLFSSVSFACANFSGGYKTAEDFSYSLVQTDCKSMDMIDDLSKITIIFDEKERLIYDLDLQSGGEVLGRLQVYISSKLENDKWIYYEKVVKTYNDGKIEIDKNWSEVFLNEEDNLVTIKHLSDGTFQRYLDRRIPDLSPFL